VHVHIGPRLKDVPRAQVGNLTRLLLVLCETYNVINLTSISLRVVLRKCSPLSISPTGYSLAFLQESNKTNFPGESELVSCFGDSVDSTLLVCSEIIDQDWEYLRMIHDMNTHCVNYSLFSQNRPNEKKNTFNHNCCLKKRAKCEQYNTKQKRLYTLCYKHPLLCTNTGVSITTETA
jgi:hypothetical protein